MFRLKTLHEENVQEFSREVLMAKTLIRWLNLPLKDPAAVGLETPYKVGINILTDIWVVMGGPHSYDCKSPTP